MSLSAAHVPSHARQLGTIGAGISFCLCPRSATLDSGPGTPQQCADHLVTDATSGGEEARGDCAGSSCCWGDLTYIAAASILAVTSHLPVETAKSPFLMVFKDSVNYVEK